jgi:hypothetical protein
LRKVLIIIILLVAQHIAFTQVLDFNATYKSALDLFTKGKYPAAKVRFIIAQRKAERERNYSGKQQCMDYIDKSDECAQLAKDGNRNFNIGEFEISKRYFDRLTELNPKDPENINRALRCRNEADFLNTKKQADAAFNNKDWNNANTLYNLCLDSTKRDLDSYKRFEKEIQSRNQECIRQMNVFNPDSIKVKLRNLKDKYLKKDKKKTEEKEKGKVPHGFNQYKDLYDRGFGTHDNVSPLYITRNKKYYYLNKIPA